MDHEFQVTMTLGKTPPNNSSSNSKQASTSGTSGHIANATAVAIQNFRATTPTGTTSTKGIMQIVNKTPAPAPVLTAANGGGAVSGYNASTKSVVANTVSTTPKATIANIEATPQTTVVASAINHNYSVAQGGANYNAAVNNAGGMYINHTWTSGSYTNNGQYVAKTAQSASTYNNYQASHHSTARATMAATSAISHTTARSAGLNKTHTAPRTVSYSTRFRAMP